MKIERVKYETQGDKRQYLPFVLTDTCDACGEDVVLDLRQEYLPYPRIGSLESIVFACPCGREWRRLVRIGFTLAEEGDVIYTPDGGVEPVPCVPATTPAGPPTTADLIREECEAVEYMLLAKNVAYGDSAIDPVRIFSRLGAEEQILVRIDDKLSRVARGNAAGEDVVADLIGYLILLRVARRATRGER